VSPKSVRRTNYSNLRDTNSKVLQENEVKNLGCLSSDSLNGDLVLSAFVTNGELEQA
jgi:hypothetical protein